MKEVVIFGMGQLAHLVHYFLTNDSSYQVVAFTVDGQHRQQDTCCGLPVIAFEEVEELYPPDKVGMFVAIGYKQLNKGRAQKCQEAKEKGYSLISYSSSHAVTWSDLKIGENCLLMEDVVVQPFAEIGDGVILCSGAHICHHTVIGDYCFIAANCVIGGIVHMGSCCFVGMNTTIRDKVNVGESCLIGAGVLLLEDAPANSAYVTEGTPRASFGSRAAKNFL
jgi:sugar O-acyltransferase (sialic acid O-acetyltransferase NeuD family)